MKRYAVIAICICFLMVLCGCSKEESYESDLEKNAGYSEKVDSKYIYEIEKVKNRQIFNLNSFSPQRYSSIMADIHQKTIYAENWKYSEVLNGKHFDNIEWSGTTLGNRANTIRFSGISKATNQKVNIMFSVADKDAEPIGVSLVLVDPFKEIVSIDQFTSLGADFEVALEYADIGISLSVSLYVYYEGLADEYYDSGDFDKALIYCKEGGISGEKRDRVYYAIAEKYIASGHIDEAIENFEKAQPYKDSIERMQKICYSEAQKYENADNYLTAMDYYGKVKNYSDAKAKYMECSYKQGIVFFDNKDYEQAIAFFVGADDYKDAKERLKESNYYQGDKLLSNGDVDGAAEHFLKAGDYKDAFERISKYYYDKGSDAFRNKDYLVAIDLFERIINYENSVDMIKESHYLYAEQLLSTGNIEKAKAHLAQIVGYKDADTRVSRYYYENGKNLMQLSKYLDAVDSFVLAGDYWDATTMVKECYYQYGKNQFALGYTSEGISYLEKCIGYKDAEDLVKSYYYVIAKELFDLYMRTGKSFTWGSDPSYEKVRNALMICEGHKDTNQMIEMLEWTNDFWNSAKKAYKMVGAEYGLEHFTVEYAGVNVEINEKGLGLYNSGEVAIIKTDIEKSYFEASIGWIAGRYPWQGYAKEIIRDIMACFTENYDDADLRKHLEESKWVEVDDENYKNSFYYGGYNVLVTVYKNADYSMVITIDAERRTV